MTESEFNAAQIAIDNAMAQARREHPAADAESVLVEAVRILAVRAVEAEKRVSGGYVRR